MPISLDELEAVAEPTILVTDLAAVHSRVSAVAVTQAAAAPTRDAASASTERAVSGVRKDATGAFSQIEEEFFRAGSEKTAAPLPSPVTFDDLDEGYQPPKFWDRVLGRKPPPKR